MLNLNYPYHLLKTVYIVDVTGEEVERLIDDIYRILSKLEIAPERGDK